MKFFVALLLAVLSGRSAAQNAELMSGIDLRCDFGFGQLVPIDQDYPDLHGRAYRTGMALVKKTDGSKWWHHLHRFPEISFSFDYVHPGTPEIFGEAFCAYPMLTFDKSRSGNFSFTFSAGTGLAWLTKRYDLITNPENTAMGSRLNNATRFDLAFRKYIAENLMCGLSAGVIHLSNAKYALPNLGLNIPFANVCLQHRLTGSVRRDYQQEGRFERSFFTGLYGGLGFTAMNAPEGPVFAVWNTTLIAGRRFSARHQFGAGIGFSYFEQSMAFQHTQEPFLENYFAHASKIHLLASCDLFFGRFAIHLEGGTRVHGDFPPEKYLVFRNGLHYYLSSETGAQTSGWFAAVYVRSSLGRAEWPEAGIGYCFAIAGKKSE